MLTKQRVREKSHLHIRTLSVKARFALRSTKDTERRATSVHIKCVQLRASVMLSESGR
jgi:hypothetical protein